VGSGSLNKKAYSDAMNLLSREEVHNLRLVAIWQNRPIFAVIYDEIRAQYGRPRNGNDYKINRTENLRWFFRKIPSEEEPVLDRLIREEERLEMIRGVEALPEHQRRVVQLRLSGMSQKRVAEKLGCTVNTVEFHMRKAKKLLAGWL
jgi:RNA polymerase sigma factor (sigma-70 family)